MRGKTAVAAVVVFVLLLTIGSAGFVYHFSQDRKKPDIALPAPAKPPALTNNQILTRDTRNDRKAALALIPPAPSQAAPTVRALPEIRNPPWQSRRASLLF